MQFKLLFLTLLLVCTFTFAQGIAVQGIARDNTDAAINNETMTFTFAITDTGGNNTVYEETQSITTDNFGVYSHVVGTGTRTAGVGTAFNDIAFGSSNMEIVIKVNYNSNEIEVYKKPFYYTPYAHHAKNGAPTGAIMPFVGNTAPEGWALCDGDLLPASATALRAMIGNNAPDLRGMFLRGTGNNPVNGLPGPTLNGTQNEAFGNHDHDAGSLVTSSAGNHNHHDGEYNLILRLDNGRGQSTDGVDPSIDEPDIRFGREIPLSGDHTHTISGKTSIKGGTETRPVNYGVNYIIKL